MSARRARPGCRGGADRAGDRAADAALAAVRARDGGRACAGRTDGAKPGAERLRPGPPRHARYAGRLRRRGHGQCRSLRAPEGNPGAAGGAGTPGVTGLARGRCGARTQYADRQQPSDGQHAAGTYACGGGAVRGDHAQAVRPGRLHGRGARRVTADRAQPAQCGRTGKQLPPGLGRPGQCPAAPVR
jgi:hypothetical protein